jgi:hypothetical protein
MSARPFTQAELTAIESHLITAHRFREALLVKAGVSVGYRKMANRAWFKRNAP